MAWRDAYRPVVRQDFDAPSLLKARSLAGREVPDPEIQVFCGAMSLNAVPQLGVWQRLFAEDAPGLAGWFQGVFAEAAQEELVEASVPKSLHSETLLITPDSAWVEALQNDFGAQTFCWCRTPKLLVIGLPTEEVWEQILASLSRPLG